MLLGKTSGTPDPPLKPCGQLLETTTEHTVNGFRVSATKGPWDSRTHVNGKLLTSKRISNCIMALRKKTVTATPAQSILLWQMCIEPHLTYCSEITFDCHKFSLKSMTQLQVDFLRTCYGLHIRSVKEVMLTDTAILPILERLLLLAIKYYNYGLNNTSHLANAALQDSIKLSGTARHSWYGSFTKALIVYDIPPPTYNTPIDLADARKRMTAHVLAKIQLSVSEKFHLSVHHDSPVTWQRKQYVNLESPLAAAIASLRFSIHFLNIELLRRTDAFRRIERQNRRSPKCPDLVEDERHALLVCPAFEEERMKWRNRLTENGICYNEEELFNLCLNPAGTDKVVLYTAIFVKFVLKTIRCRCTTGGRL